MVCLHEDRYCIDDAVPFGIGNGPIFGNEVNDVVIAFIKDEFMDRIKAKDVECEAAFANGASSEEQDEWRKNREATHMWQQERATALRSKYPDESDEWIEEQASHHCWMGFYDDGMFATFEFLFKMLVEVAIYITTRINLKVSLHKTECATANGRLFTVDAEAWTEEGELRWNMSILPVKQYIVVLGKELDIGGYRRIGLYGTRLTGSKRWRSVENARRNS